MRILVCGNGKKNVGRVVSQALADMDDLHMNVGLARVCYDARKPQYCDHDWQRTYKSCMQAIATKKQQVSAALTSLLKLVLKGSSQPWVQLAELHLSASELRMARTSISNFVCELGT